jgi:hypothetical protein
MLIHHLIILFMFLFNISTEHNIIYKEISKICIWYISSPWQHNNAQHILRYVCCLSSSCVPHVVSFHWLSIFACPFGILYRLFISLDFYWYALFYPIVRLYQVPFTIHLVHLRFLIELVLLILFSFLCCVVIFLFFCCVCLFFLYIYIYCLSSSCVLRTKCWQCIWIVHSWLPCRFSLTVANFSGLSILVVPSVFSNCCQCLWIVHSWCPDGFL